MDSVWVNYIASTVTTLRELSGFRKLYLLIGHKRNSDRGNHLHIVGPKTLQVHSKENLDCRLSKWNVCIAQSYSCYTERSYWNSVHDKAQQVSAHLEQRSETFFFDSLCKAIHHAIVNDHFPPTSMQGLGPLPAGHLQG